MVRKLMIIVVLACLLTLGIGRQEVLAGGGASNADSSSSALELGRQTLPENDGWASFSTGTTGGSAAAPERVFTVTNRQELVAAIGSRDGTPTIIYVQGVIDANVDDQGQPLDCSDYALNGYSLEAYLAAYDPATWGRTRPTGPLENARLASQRNQAARMRINLGSNTTLVGLGQGAMIRGANIVVNLVDNVIIRNIHFQGAYDCFPAWDPTDGSLGNWNSQYDNVSVMRSSHVWVDHCVFDDGANTDSSQPLYFGRPLQVHDGLLDITHGSDLVTVSWNSFADHDKTMLIGSTDSPTLDLGKLRVTLHHNRFSNVGQRAPRVRYGQVHVYNNFYQIPNPESYVYSWGAGIQSMTYAKNNYFELAEGVTPDKIITVFKGTAWQASGTLINGHTPANEVDVVAAYNAERDPDLGSDVGWTPVLHTKVHPAQAVPGLVGHNAGLLQP